MSPEVVAGQFVFVSVANTEGLPQLAPLIPSATAVPLCPAATASPVPPARLTPLASITEPEGLSLVLTREQADDAGLSYSFVAAWITLRVHSSLNAVGLTAAVSTALAEAGLSCNVIAGFHHDHLLVPHDRVGYALEVLHAVASDTDLRAQPVD